jgi:outer membrane protein OmpA-like peptidoglycan-associated protein
MMMRKSLATAAVALLAAHTAQAADQDMRRNFVGCPILRDTKTVPCWLSEYKGELYYLGIQQDAAADFYPPYLGHQVLVEGVVSDAPRICGGVVLKPVTISNLPELDPACNTMLPAEDRYTVPFAVRLAGPNPKPSLGRRIGGAPPAQAPKGPFVKKTFAVYYDFDVDWANRWTRVLSEAAAYAKASDGQVQVVAYRAATRLSDGRDFVERPDIAERRARRLRQTLTDIGIAPDALKIDWRADALPGAGVDDFKGRRAEITVIPKAGVAQNAPAADDPARLSALAEKETSKR